MVRRILPLTVVMVALAGTVMARVPDVRCAGCHGGGPRLVHDVRTGRVRDIAIPLGLQRRSWHGRLACRTCHVGRFDLFPHPPRQRETRRCRDCHPRRERRERFPFERLAREVEKSAHGQLAGFACESCHEPHRAGASRPESVAAAVRAGRTLCLGCHDSTARGTLTDPLRPDPVAAHAALARPRLHLRRVRCGDCHTARGEDPISHTLPAAPEVTPCRRCHGRPTILIPRLAHALAGGGAPPASEIPPATTFELPGWLTGAERPWRLDLAGSLLVLVGVLSPWWLRRRLDLAPEAPPWLRRWHAATVLATLLLLASGLVLHFGLVGFALADGLHLAAGLGLWGALLGLLAQAAARGGLARWHLTGGLRTALCALGRTEPELEDSTVGALRALVYRLVVLGLLPLLAVTGLALMAQVRLSGPDGARGWADELAARIHLTAAWALAAFLAAHLALALTTPTARGRIPAMLWPWAQGSSRRSRSRHRRARAT